MSQNISKIPLAKILSDVVTIERGLYSTSPFVREQSKRTAKNMRDYVVTASSNQNIKIMSDQNLQENLEAIEEAMKRNHDNAEHQRILRENHKNISTELNNRKTKSNNEPTTKN